MAKHLAFSARFARKPAKEVPPPNVNEMEPRQRRALPFAVVLALVLGVILIGRFFTVILVSLLAAILFYPVYTWFLRKLHRPGTAAMLTFLVTLLAIIIPLTITVMITYVEIRNIIEHLTTASAQLHLTAGSTDILNRVNQWLDTLTGGNVQLTIAEVQDTVSKLASELASFFLGVLSASFSGIANLITQFILYMYIFTSLLVNADSLKETARRLNPLGDEANRVYFARTGQMTRGAVGGQFVIAFAQGITEAAVLYIAGLPYFFFFALVLSFLSVVPLGGGILAIPIGILMILSGNYWQGIFVLLMHFLVITNIDNVLRPRLISKSIRLNSALMMLAVFGGIGIFGFLGIAVGPVIMILVLTTVQMYLSATEAPVVAKRKARVKA